MLDVYTTSRSSDLSVRCRLSIRSSCSALVSVPSTPSTRIAIRNAFKSNSFTPLKLFLRELKIVSNLPLPSRQSYKCSMT